jgi:Sigma-70, region 4
VLGVLGMDEVDNHLLLEQTNESWRTWLRTGARRKPLDPRRLQGAHRGLKKILAEGLVNNGTASEHVWKDFSGAMVRHAVDEAMHALPPTDSRVVKLAYFGGYSNRAIAHDVGTTEAGVERRLRRALAAISDYIQHGRMAVRRAGYWIGLVLGGRWLGEVAKHGWQAAAVTTAAVVIVGTQDAPAPSSAGTPQAQPAVVAPAGRTVVPPLPSPSLPVALPSPGRITGAVPTVQQPSLPLVPQVIQKIKKIL